MSNGHFIQEESRYHENTDKISGYDLVKGILNKTGDLETIIDCADRREQEWLEFKAGMRLLPEDRLEKRDEDLWWNVTKAIISMMNSVGGAVVIGVCDPPDLHVVPLETCDPDNIIEEQGIDTYLREEIMNKVCPQKKKWTDSKGETYVLKEKDCCLDCLLEIKKVSYQGHEIAAILVKPKEGKCIRVYKIAKGSGEEQEYVYFRKKGFGDVKRITFSEEIFDYEKNRTTVDGEYTAILEKIKGHASPKRLNPFFGKWRKMIQDMDGMKSLLQSNEHDALAKFCEIVEKAIRDIDMFCNGSPRDLSLEEYEIHQVWEQLKESGELERKLNVVSVPEFPDLSEIISLKSLDAQNSPKLGVHLRKLFFAWECFATDLADLFPSETGDEDELAKNNLPQAFENMDFVGREEQLNEILQFLSHRENRNYFLTITGEGGMGKTTLALAAAYAVLNLDPKTSGVAKEDLTYQNIIWASAKNRDFQDQHECQFIPDIEDYGGLLDTILSVVSPGHSLVDLNTKKIKVQQILQGTRSLLIVDNMETINDDRVFLYLKKYIPNHTKIIGTDRNRGKTDRVIQLPPMNPEESKSMIKSLAKEKTECFTEEDYTVFHSLSYGIPKVIEWGCRLLTTQDVGIEDVFRYLRDAKKGKKNQIFEYLFGFSYEKLTDNAKTILNTLAQFDFPVQCSLIGKLTEEEKGLDDYINELSSFTLLTIINTGVERSLFEKYASVQDYIRDYAAAKAESNPDFDKHKIVMKARKVFLEEIIHKCGTTGWPHREAYEWCGKNYAMIQWVFQQICSSGNNIETIHSFMISAVPVLSNIGMPDAIDRFCKKSLATILNIFDADPAAMDLSSFVELLLSSFRKSSDELKNIAADIMEQWAWNMFRQARNNYIEVSRILNALHEEASEIKSAKVNILVLRTLALIDKEKEDLDNAEKKLLEVVEQARQNGDLHIEAITYGSLGSTYREKNDLNKACFFMEKAFSKLKEIEDQDSVLEVRSVFCQKYAKLKIKSGKIEDAEEYIKKATLIDRAIGRQYGFAHDKQLRAIIYEQKKNYSQAFRYIKEAKDIFIRLNSGKEVEADYERIKSLFEKQQFT